MSLCNNCTEEKERGSGTGTVLRGGHVRTAFCLGLEIKALCDEVGLERMGFLTLTYPDDKCPLIKESARRFKSVRTHVLAGRYGRSIWVLERGEKNGRLHWHGVVTLWGDIRTGFDFTALRKRDYRSANALLRSEWEFWRSAAARYGFGRTELLPVRSSSEGIAHYVGGYLVKGVPYRRAEDKGARFVHYVGYRLRSEDGSVSLRKAMGSMAWVNYRRRSDGVLAENVRAWVWRHQLAKWAGRHGFEDLGAVRSYYGPRWAFRLRDVISGEWLTRVECGVEHPDRYIWSTQNVLRVKPDRVMAMLLAEARGEI